MIERSIRRSIPGIASFISGINSGFDSIKLSTVLIQICKICRELLQFDEGGKFILTNSSDASEIEITSEYAVELIKNLGDNFCVTVSIDGYLLRESTRNDLQEKIVIEYYIPSLTIYYEDRPIGNIKSVLSAGKKHRWEKNAKELRKFDELISWFEENKVLHGTALDHIWKNKSKKLIVEQPEKKIQATMNEFFLDYILEPIIVQREVKYPSGICDFRLDDRNGFVVLVEIKVVGKTNKYKYKYQRVTNGITQLHTYCTEEFRSIGRLLVFDGESPRVSFNKQYNHPIGLEILFVYMVKKIASRSS